ncbi:MAG: ABC transporter ATP-binding protein [bacterium]
MRPLDPVVTEALSRRFGAVVALRGVGLRVREGTCLLLLGPNGSGKTTLLRVLATALRPTEGRAWVWGYDVVSEGHRVREVCAYLGTSPGVYAGLTGFENLCLAADLCGRPRQRVPELLAWAGLEPVAHRLTGTYSLGMRRRLALARVRLQDPQVLLLDEPFVGLDEEGARLVGELVGGIKDRGGAVVLATHDHDRARVLCDAVAELDSGRLLSYGPAGLAGAVNRG